MYHTSAFFLGMVISFLGQLPIGYMSLTATQIAVQENIRNAWKYSIGVALIEMIYLLPVLLGIQWIISHKLFFNIFNWITVAFFIAAAILSFRTAGNPDNRKKAPLLENKLNRFLLGISMGALNPAQIPFWFLWTGYFLNIGWLKPGLSYFNFFIIGSGFGTVAGFLVYIYGGNFLVKKWHTSNRTLNKIMAIIFIIAAIAQTYRIVH